MTHKSTRVLIQSQTTNVSKVFGGSIEPSIYLDAWYSICLKDGSILIS